MANGAVLYFHGSSSEPDIGPADLDADHAGIDLTRHVRPGYDSDTQSQASLRDVAAGAVEEAAAATDRLVLMGWSGGGPYALAGGSLGHPAVCGIALLGSWAPMNPPDRGLPLGVQLFMRFGRWAPRPILQCSLAAVGIRNPGHVDDIHRVARPWGFDPADVAAGVPVAAWHADHDHETPIGPWAQAAGIDLHRLPGSDHHPTAETWRAALGWARDRVQ